MRSSRSRWGRAGRAIGVCAVAVVIAHSGVARAEPKGGPDSVTLQDGTVVTGTFTELVPQNRITVLSNGEAKTFQWSFVRKATHDGKVVAENAQVAPTTPPPGAVVVVQPQPQQQVVVVQGQQPPSASAEEEVFVHLEADEEAVLEMKNPEGSNFTAMCHAPCDRRLPVDRIYRVSGDGLRKSANFKLAGEAGKPLILDVNPGHKGAFVGGIVMTALGPVTALSGLVVYGISALASSLNSGSGSGGKTVGGVMMLTGLALTAVGIPLIVTNSSTKVTQEVGTPARRDDGKLNVRLPEFRDVAHEVPMPNTSYAPVFGVAF